MKAMYIYEDGIQIRTETKQDADYRYNKIKKCKYCDGKGLVQIAPNVRGLKKCPHCGGVDGIIKNLVND